jgi:hypothetical protein
MKTHIVGTYSLLKDPFIYEVRSEVLPESQSPTTTHFTGNGKPSMPFPNDIDLDFLRLE